LAESLPPLRVPRCLQPSPRLRRPFQSCLVHCERTSAVWCLHCIPRLAQRRDHFHLLASVPSIEAAHSLRDTYCSALADTQHTTPRQR
jgi:hypothetical protein